MNKIENLKVDEQFNQESHTTNFSNNKTVNSANKKKSLPKIALISGIILTGIIAVLGIWQFTSSSNNPAPTPSPEPAKRRVVEPANVIPVSERPVVFIQPEPDGRNLTIEVLNVRKPAKNIEFDLEYQAGELLQGVSGSISLEAIPARTTQLMGTCSAGGKCSYHENVQGGSLQLRFLGQENYLLKQDWRYIDNKTKENIFASKDAKFQLTSPGLSSIRYAIVYQSPGAPDNLEGELTSEIYALATSSKIDAKDVEVTIRANEEDSTAIAGWDGENWTITPVTPEGKSVSAKVKPARIYVAIKQ